MRIIILLLFVGFFALTPMLLLDTLVMPQLESLQYTYSHLDETAARVAGQ